MTENPRTFLEAHSASLAALAEDLLGFDTRNPPGRTRDAFAYVERYLSDLGLDPERVVTDPGKPNLLVELPGEADATLLLNGHLDTVPFDEDEWAHDPLGERRGDRIYGRGATDMKGSVAAMLGAVRAFAETDTTPALNLQLLLVSGEETGDPAGLDAVFDAEAVEADACVVGETTCERGRHSVTVADRGSIWLTLEAAGRSAHGSRPMLGTNAIDRLYAAVADVREALSTYPLSIPDEVEAILDETVEYFDPILGRETARELFAHPTVNLGTLAGGEAINSVPARARARLDLRVTAGVDTEAVLADVRDLVAAHDGVSVADAGCSLGTYTAADAPLVDATVATATDVLGERVFRRSATGGGDAKTFRNAGIPTIEFALGTDTVHAVDEYTTVQALEGNAAIYAGLPAALADRLPG